MLALALVTFAVTSQAAGAGDKAGALCRASLARALPALERAPMQGRLNQCLEVLAVQCPNVLGELATAAMMGRRLPRLERAKRLAAATGLARPCTSAEPGMPAGALVRDCPPAPLKLDTSIGRDVDAGTYLFVVATARKLEAAGAFDASAERVLSSLVLAAALEGEARRAAKVRRR